MGDAPRVVVTDMAWPEPGLEKDILTEAGLELLLAETGEEDELVAFVPGAVGILTCWKLVTARVIDAAADCIVISRFGIGLDNIDVDYATEKGIIVTYVPTYWIEDVSDHAIALIMTLARKSALYDRTLKSRNYDRGAGYPMRRLKGQTVGVVQGRTPPDLANPQVLAQENLRAKLG